MSNISIHEYCFGCGVCAAACPHSAILMDFNKDGFYRPVVNGDLCNSCGICNKVCSANYAEICYPTDRIQPFCAGAWSSDSEIRKECTSGGIAYEIGRNLFDSGYSYCGVRYDTENNKVEHFFADNQKELVESIGSKYIQSDTFSAFSKFSKDKKYVVVGTPCQIDSLRRYIRLKKIEDNFILVDFFCHSVPSKNLWDSYLKMSDVGTLRKVKFRSKINGWHDSTYIIIIIGDKKNIYSPFSKGDKFFWFFLGDRCANLSCIKDCKYKQMGSSADIRLGDFWGRKYINDEKGVSTVVAFSEKGKKVISSLKDCNVEECDFETAADNQMKCNARLKRSYYVTLYLLKNKVPLRVIYAIDRIIELPDSFPRFILKAFNKIKKIVSR